MPHFADQLLDAIAAKNAPVCVGIDPVYARLPDAVAGPADSRDAADVGRVIESFAAFIDGVLAAVAAVVPCVKFQSAYFERLGPAGVALYFEKIAAAKELGLLTIGDVKRGDIGPTSVAYADAHLLGPSCPDAITVNPMLGIDTVEPFLEAATGAGKGLFVLVRTSNPGSADLQDARLEDGRTWCELLADSLRPLAASQRNFGKSGYSALGAVVGATQPHTMQSLRKRLPTSIFLLPGYGTQGATAEMTRAAFDENGRGAIVSASRSVLYPDANSADWREDVERAALDMKYDLAESLRR